MVHFMRYISPLLRGARPELRGARMPDIYIQYDIAAMGSTFTSSLRYVHHYDSDYLTMKTT